jgi:predicted RNase H-like HicB family nuclease
MNKYLRCYIKREDKHWVAICIDLGLAAQAGTLQEAKDKLYSILMCKMQ